MNELGRMDNKPRALSGSDIDEIAAIKGIREMWGAETPEEMADILRTQAYSAKFDFTSGSPGYCGDYIVIQGDSVGNHPPIELIRDRHDQLVRLIHE